MSNSTSSYHCPSCSAPISFKPESQKFVCDYCLSEYTTQQMEEAHRYRMAQEASKAQRKAARDTEKQAEQAGIHTEDDVINEYNCGNCGAHVVTTDTTTSTFCFYCHSPVVIETRLQGDFKPDQILPFKISEEQAKEEFLRWAGTKKYLPPDFTSTAQLEKMTGVYIPYWFVDTTLDVDFAGTSQSSSSWRSGDYRYTRTTSSEHVRQGTFELTDVNFAAFSKIDQNLLYGVEPFDPVDCIPFSIPMLQGFFAEQYTMSENEAKAPMNQEIAKIAKDMLYRSFPGGASVRPTQESITGSEIDLLFTLLPIWVLTYQYEGRTFVYAMNGQTGKAFGEMPIFEKKLKSDATRRGIITGIVLGILALIATLIVLVLAFQ